MRNFKLRFSLRTLLAIFTVAAIVIAFTATYLQIVIGAVVMAMLLLQPARGLIIRFIEAWPEFKTPPLAKPPRTDAEPSAHRRSNL
jgi:predicted tellurium resistance membrane protein TerC